MGVNRGLGPRNLGAVGTTPKELRLSMAGLVAQNSPGVPRVGVLDPNTATIVTGTNGWAYSVAANNPVLVRGAADGVYLPTFSDVTSIPCSVAPGSGFRYDLVWVKQNDPDRGDPDNQAYVGITEGLAASSPAKPYADVPEGALVYAEALVGAGATSTSHPSVTIAQVFPYTTTRGGVLTIRDAADRNTITAPGEDQTIRRLDRGDALERYRTVSGAGAWRSSTESIIPDGSLMAGWAAASTADNRRPRIWSPDGNTVHLGGGVKFNNGGANILSIPTEFRPTSGALRYLNTVLASNGGADTVNGAVIELFLEDGVVRIGYQSKSVAASSFIPLSGTWSIR